MVSIVLINPIADRAPTLLGGGIPRTGEGGTCIIYFIEMHLINLMIALFIILIVVICPI